MNENMNRTSQQQAVNHTSQLQAVNHMAGTSGIKSGEGMKHHVIIYSLQIVIF